MSDDELRRRLQEVDYAGSYMYVTKIHTLETRGVGFGGALETVLYGESDAALQSLLSLSGRWGGLPPGVADSAQRLAGSIKTPGAMESARGVDFAESTESWLNTIVKFGLYLSHPTSFEEMKDPQNRISKYAILNNSIPKDRTDNSYEMREPLAGFYMFESVIAIGNRRKPIEFWILKVWSRLDITVPRPWCENLFVDAKQTFFIVFIVCKRFQ